MLHRINIRKLFLSLSFLLFIIHSAFTEELKNSGVPIMRSFNFKEKFFKEIWSVVQDKRGVMFFGAQGGVFEFNSVDNTEYILTNTSSAVRALCVDDDGIVFFGARKEMGYLKPEKNGKLKYVSLRSKLDSLDRNFTEVCKIYNTVEGICFQTFEALYFYKNGKFKIVKSSTSFHFSFYINNILYVLERGVGLNKYENGKMLLMPGGQDFSDDRIYSILPYQKNKLLIATRERGCFIYDLNPANSTPISSFAREASNYLIENQVYDGKLISDSTIIYGTLQGGLVIVNKKGEITKILNSTNLLDDDKINYLYLDNYGDLWVAQDNAVSIVELNSPYTLFKDKDALSGKIQSVMEFNGRIYVSTPLGVYYKELKEKNYKEFSNPKFKQLELKSQYFTFLKLKDGATEKLMVASASGLFEVNGNSMNTILDEYCFNASQSGSNPNIVYVGLKSGFAMLTKTGAKWKVSYPDNNIKDEIKSIGEDKLGNLWLATSKEGIYKISKEGLQNLNALGSKEYAYQKFDTSNGLPNVNFNKVFSVENELIFGTVAGFYKFNYQLNRFYSDTIFNTALGNLSSQIIDFCQFNSTQFLVLSIEDNSGTLISILEKSKMGLIAYTKPFRRLLEYTETSISPGQGNTVWMSSSSGIINADLKSIKLNSSISERKYNVLLRSVFIGNDSLIFGGTFYQDKKVDSDLNFYPVVSQPVSFIPKIEYVSNSIEFNFSYSFNEPSGNNIYSFYLEGYEDTWKPWVSDTRTAYSNLSEGRYRFHIKAKNIYDTESNETIYEFVILPPWYHTLWAYLIYAVLFSGFVYSLVQLSVRRLKQAKVVLENTVKERTSEIVKQNEEIQKQKDIVEIKNKDITDSINYAKRIQDTILPPDHEIKQLLPDSFILFLPKDILSGDFYWLDEIDGKVLVAAVDCTGHGVPGALMSIVGNNILNQAILEHKISKPSAILDELNKGVTNTLRQKNEESKVKDGMDIALIALDKQNSKLEFSGANNPLYHVRNGELTEIKGNKFPIGIFIGEEQKHFTNHELQLQKGDTVYLFTDGYADQFGGPLGKKFKYNQFKTTLLQIQNLPIHQQREKLLTTIRNWQGENEQVDDILVIGTRF